MIPWQGLFTDAPDSPAARRRRRRMERAWERTALACNPPNGRMMQLCEAQNWRCCWCGKRMTYAPGPLMATREHILALCDSGTGEWLNLAAACLLCNNRRHHPNTPEAPPRAADRRRRVLLE